MATMTNTLNSRVRAANNRVEGLKASGLKFEFGYVTFSGTYTTGGDDWTPETIDYDRTVFADFEIDSTGYKPYWNPSTKHLTLWNGTTEHSAATCALVFRYMIVGY